MEIGLNRHPLPAPAHCLRGEDFGRGGTLVDSFPFLACSQQELRDVLVPSPRIPPAAPVSSGRPPRGTDLPARAGGARWPAPAVGGVVGLHTAEALSVDGLGLNAVAEIVRNDVEAVGSVPPPGHHLLDLSMPSALIAGEIRN